MVDDQQRADRRRRLHLGDKRHGRRIDPLRQMLVELVDGGDRPAACDRGRLAVGLRMRLKQHVEPFAEDIGGAVDVRRLDRFLQRHHVRLQLGEALLDHFAAQLPCATNAPEVLRQDSHQLRASLYMCRRATAVCPPMERTRFHALERSDTGESQGSAPCCGVGPRGLLRTGRPPVLWPSTRRG